MTNSDTKEWVTVKIPKAIRDDAREDPRTYGDIMRDGLVGPSVPETDPSEIPGALDDAMTADLPREVLEQLDRIESAATTAEARTGRIEGTLEDMGGR